MHSGRPTQLDAPGDFALQVFAGYDAADVALLQKYFHGPITRDGMIITDALGCKTTAPSEAIARAAIANGPVPAPSDGWHAEAIEYASLLYAFERRADVKRFTVFELGAGWGPWIAYAGVLGRQYGVPEVNLIGVEASDSQFKRLKQHLELNRLRPRGWRNDTHVGGTRAFLVHGAAWHTDTELYFPKRSPGHDMGAAVSTARHPRDYRGMRAPHERVRAYSVPRLMARFGVVDYMHIDIQGAENSLLQASLDALRAHVRVLFVATHSRKVEGDLLDLLFMNGWKLRAEKPCRFFLNSNAPTLEGRVDLDGAQVWLNPDLV